MADRGTAGQDLFQIWLASSRTLFAAEPMPDSLKERCEALFAAWNRFARTCAEASGTQGEASGGPFDPAGWLDAAGEGDLWRWFGGGDGADPWRDERDALTASPQWLAYTAALERYRAVMSAAWLNAFKHFTEDLARDRAPGDALPDWAAIEARWQETAGAQLAAAQHAEDFLAAQRDLIRARLDCSALLRGRIERIAGMLGLPTRAELDDLHRSVHDLKRELRALGARPDDEK
ncbi:MAG: poly(R)-hydroxyalkanoic acid synthase subunit PhaE [Alphaproteobacteria bacterium]